MAREPSVELPRPPNEDQLERQRKGNKTQAATPHNSSHSSSKSQNTKAINIAISEKELDGAHKIIPPEHNVTNPRKKNGVMVSPSQDVYRSKKSTDSTAPVQRNHEAIFEEDANKSPELRP
ncbi:hypothetical protein KY285_016399 [Solanum tuberosum]|nr:hypothetical protein KY284_016396 [Solanum tuberosum]KAH0702121.1 hypothetical protein KY285_016399 [Solanum tuberosum]